MSRTEYETAAKNIKNVFNTPKFNDLNRAKVDDILYILVKKENSPRFGVIFGKQNDTLRCPFSSPFGYIEMLKKDQPLKYFYEAIAEIEKVLKDIGITDISFFLPPDFYDNYCISAWYNVMSQSAYSAEYVDLNFSLHIPEIYPNYEEHIHHNAKKNLNIALKSDLKLREAMTQEDKTKAYDIIRQNREGKGYPLRMTEEQVLATIVVVPAHMYIVSAGDEDIAASLIYDVTPTIAQVIYWGDIPGHSEKKSINYLSYQLLQIYHDRDFEYLDIGPSTENGQPNFGLCDFKDSIGCMRTAKVRFTKSLN